LNIFRQLLTRQRRELVPERLRQDIDRTRSVHDARKIYKNRIDENVRQSHQEQDGESHFVLFEDCSIEFNRTLRVWLTCFPYIH